MQRRARRRQSHLKRGAQISAHQRDLAPREARSESQSVERIVVSETVAHRGDRVGNQRHAGNRRERLGLGSMHRKDLQVRARQLAVGARAKIVRVFGQHRDAEVLQRRHQFGENRRVAEPDTSEYRYAPGRGGHRSYAVRLDVEIAAAGKQRLDVFDIADRALDVERGLVIGAERAAPSRGERASALGPSFSSNRSCKRSSQALASAAI